MFSSGPNYSKLKTLLRLALNRLKLLEKKKTELAQKSRKEIGEYLATGKIERARIRVEHIIREDYLVESMEIVEMYCDLLLARFGLVTQMKELDDGIAEAVYSLVWVSPRLQTDVSELKAISDLLIRKYGPEFSEHARTATGNHKISEKLMHKLAIQAPPKLLVEKYLIEIAKNYNIEYEPDPQVMKDDFKQGDQFLIDLSDRNNLGGTAMPPQMGFIGYPQPPQLPSMPDPPSNKPFNYPPPFGGAGGGSGSGVSNMPPFAYNIPPNPQPPTGQPEKKDLNINSNFIQEEGKDFPSSNSSSGSPDENLQTPNAHNSKQFDSKPPRYSSIVTQDNLQNSGKPKPQPRSKMPPNIINPSAPTMDIPNLPNIPSDLPDMANDEDKNNDDELDLDDLFRRFSALKKK